MSIIKATSSKEVVDFIESELQGISPNAVAVRFFFEGQHDVGGGSLLCLRSDFLNRGDGMPSADRPAILDMPVTSAWGSAVVCVGEQPLLFYSPLWSGQIGISTITLRKWRASWYIATREDAPMQVSKAANTLLRASASLVSEILYNVKERR